jgi:hypothetical protein
MSAASGTPRSSAKRFAQPAALLLFTGVVLAWGYWGANGEDAPPQLAAAGSEVVSDVEVPAPQLSPLLRNASPAGVRRPAGRPNSVVVRDLDAGFSQLHASMATTPVNVADRDRVIADLDQDHEAETIDPVWSATVEQGLEAASVSQVMTAAGFNPQGVSSDCRSRSCRISARFSSASEARDWADRLLTQMAGNIVQARVAVLPQTDGSFEVRVYGSRKAS